MATTYSVSAKLHSRKTKSGFRPVYVLYIYNKDSTPFPTFLQVHEDDWDPKGKLAKVGTPGAVGINTRIQQLQADLLGIASGLSDPRHDLVKRRFAELASKKSNEAFNRKVNLAFHIGELGQIEAVEEKLAQDQTSLEQRKAALRPALPALASIGILTKEAAALAPAVKEFGVVG